MNCRVKVNGFVCFFPLCSLLTLMEVFKKVTCPFSIFSKSSHIHGHTDIYTHSFLHVDIHIASCNTPDTSTKAYKQIYTPRYTQACLEADTYRHTDRHTHTHIAVNMETHTDKGATQTQIHIKIHTQVLWHTWLYAIFFHISYFGQQKNMLFKIIFV